MKDDSRSTSESPDVQMLGLFVPLDVDFASDEKLCECTVEAEHVFLRSLALCKRTLSDGTVTLTQLRRECEKLDRSQLADAIDDLVRVGLFGWVDQSRLVLPSWLKRNPSKMSLVDGKTRAVMKSRLGNHTRWHVKEGVQDPTCELCFPRSIPVSHGESKEESHGESHCDSISIRKGSEVEQSKAIAKPQPSEAKSPSSSTVTYTGATSEPEPEPIAAEPPEPPKELPPHLVMTDQVLAKLGMVKPAANEGEVKAVKVALKHGWTWKYLEPKVEEFAAKATHNVRRYVFTSIANLLQPPDPIPMVTCPDCHGETWDYNHDPNVPGHILPIECSTCDNRRRVPASEADF